MRASGRGEAAWAGEWNDPSVARAKLRGRVAKYAACGWAVVQMDLDGRLTPPCGVGGVMPVVSEVQRTI